ncbi:MAG: M48 family metallopeptidase [Patescibacteria group bacterium]|nr:M48 family metallopeptidase [Patescibacteria group bacterium]
MYKEIAQNRERTIFIMAMFFVVVVGVGYLFAYIYEDISIVIGAVVFALIMNWVGYFKSDAIALSASRARPVRPDTNLSERQAMHLVENLSITAGLLTPKLYIMEDPSINAFATGRDPKHASVALTTGALEKLEKVELEGVIAHELSHVKNYDILLATVAITMVGIVTLLADWFTRVRLYNNRSSNNKEAGWLAVLAIVLIVLAPLFAKLLQLAVSRGREYLADASGAMLTRYPEGLAAALEKIAADTTQGMPTANRATAHLFIASPFEGKIKTGARSWFSTHPPIEERVKRLREMNL